MGHALYRYVGCCAPPPTGRRLCLLPYAGLYPECLPYLRSTVYACEYMIVQSPRMRRILGPAATRDAPRAAPPAAAWPARARTPTRGAASAVPRVRPSEVRPRSGPVWPGKNRANETASIYNESETLVQSSLNIPSKLPRTGPQVSYRATTTGTLSLSTNKRVRRTRLTRTVTSRPRQIVTSVYR